MHSDGARRTPYRGLSQRDEVDVTKAEASMRETVESLVSPETFRTLDRFVRDYLEHASDHGVTDGSPWIPVGSLMTPGLLFDNDTRARSVVNRVLSILTRSSDVKKGRLPQLDRRHGAFSQAYLDSTLDSNPYTDAPGDGKERARRIYLTEALRQVRTKEIDFLARQTLRAWGDGERLKWLEAFKSTPELPVEVRTLRDAAAVLYAIIRQTHQWLTDKTMEMFVEHLCELAQRDAEFANELRKAFDRRRAADKPTLRERVAAFACWSAATVRFKNSVENLYGASLPAGVGALALASTPAMKISDLASRASLRGGRTAETLTRYFVGPLFARELYASLVGKAVEDLVSLQVTSEKAAPAQHWRWQISHWLQAASPAPGTVLTAAGGESWLSAEPSLYRLLDRAVKCSGVKKIRAGDYVGYSCPLESYRGFAEQQQRQFPTSSIWELKQRCDLKAAEVVLSAKSADAPPENEDTKLLFRQIHEKRWRVVLHALQASAGPRPDAPSPRSRFHFYKITSDGDDSCTPAPSAKEANHTLLLEMRSETSVGSTSLQEAFAADQRKLESSRECGRSLSRERSRLSNRATHLEKHAEEEEG